MNDIIKDAEDQIQKYLLMDIKEDLSCSWELLCNNPKVDYIEPILEKMMQIEKFKFKLFQIVSGSFTENEWELIFENLHSFSNFKNKQAQLKLIWEDIERTKPRRVKKLGINMDVFKEKVLHLTQKKLSAIEWLDEYRNCYCGIDWDDNLWLANLNNEKYIRMNKLKQCNKVCKATDK